MIGFHTILLGKVWKLRDGIPVLNVLGACVFEGTVKLEGEYDASVKILRHGIFVCCRTKYRGWVTILCSGFVCFLNKVSFVC